MKLVIVLITLAQQYIIYIINYVQFDFSSGYSFTITPNTHTDTHTHTHTEKSLMHKEKN